MSVSSELAVRLPYTLPMNFFLFLRNMHKKNCSCDDHGFCILQPDEYSANGLVCLKHEMNNLITMLHLRFNEFNEIKSILIASRGFHQIDSIESTTDTRWLDEWTRRSAGLSSDTEMSTVLRTYRERSAMSLSCSYAFFHLPSRIFACIFTFTILKRYVDIT